MKQRIRHLIYFIILIAIDQAVKMWVRVTLMNNDPIVILPDILKLQYHENTGAVWGIMSGKVAFLRVLTIIIFLLIVYVYMKIPKDKKYNPLKIVTVFILAGAVGNLIDRISLGHVVDFIYFEIINFPLFNVADSYLTVSTILLFILAIFYYKDEDFTFLENMFSGKKKAKKSDVIDDKSVEVDKAENTDESEDK